MKKIALLLAFIMVAVGAWASEEADSVTVQREYLPSDYVPGDWSVGFHAGVGGLFSSGDIADGFSSAFTFNAGLSAGYRRFVVEGRFLYGSPSIESPNITGAVDADGVAYHANINSANMFGAGANVGFTVVDYDRFSVTPWIGGMWTTCRWTARPMQENSEGVLTQLGEQRNMSVEDFNLAFGVNFEWHFARTETDVALFGSDGQEYTSSVRLSPYMIKCSYSDAHPELSGWQIGVSVAYTGVLRALGIKY